MIQLENLKSFFGNFLYVNDAKALQQLSTLEFSLEAHPGARAKLFMKLHTSYSCDPVREDEPASLPCLRITGLPVK